MATPAVGFGCVRAPYVTRYRGSFSVISPRFCCDRCHIRLAFSDVGCGPSRTAGALCVQRRSRCLCCTTSRARRCAASPTSERRTATGNVSRYAGWLVQPAEHSTWPASLSGCHDLMIPDITRLQGLHRTTAQPTARYVQSARCSANPRSQQLVGQGGLPRGFEAQARGPLAGPHPSELDGQQQPPGAGAAALGRGRVHGGQRPGRGAHAHRALHRVDAPRAPQPRGGAPWARVEGVESGRSQTAFRLGHGRDVQCSNTRADWSGPG